jgi:3-phytase
VAIIRQAEGALNVAANSASWTFPRPAVCQPDDVLRLQITTTSSTAVTFTPPSGAILVLASAVGSADNVQSVEYLYVLPSSMPTDIVVGLSAAGQGTIAWAVYRGADPTSPVDAPAVSTAQNGTASTSATTPSITTVTAGAMVVGGHCMGSGSTTVISTPSPWVVVADGTRRNGLLLERGIMASPGATGTAAWTFSASQQVRAYAYALRPATGTPLSGRTVNATSVTDPFPTGTGDIADGASIVPNRANPAASKIIGTNKAVGGGGGLFVYDLQGDILSSVTPGAANSVDHRDLTGVAGWGNVLLVMTTDREANLLRYYTMNVTTGALTAAGTTSLGYEPYGSCLYVHSTGVVYAFVSERGPDDTSARNWHQYPLSWSGSAASAGSAVRTVNVTSVVEGMAADDATGYLFMSQEDVGLYRYSAAPGGGSPRTAVDTVGAGNLLADVEDVAIAYSPQGTKLVVSSQGDSSYHVYDATTLAHELRFVVMRPGGSPAVGETDGLDIFLGNLGPAFPNGLLVVHDGTRTPVSGFALVDTALIFDAVYPADQVALTDAVTTTSARARPQADALGVGDTVAVTVSLARTQADPVGLTDAVSVSLVSSGSRLIPDTVGLTDAVAVTMTRVRTVADVVGVVDATSGGAVSNDLPITLGATPLKRQKIGTRELVARYIGATRIWP